MTTRQSNDNYIKKRVKILIIAISSFSLIVLFQNCGQDGFQTKIRDQLDLASESQNDQMDLPEINDDEEMREITDIFNNPQNESNSEVSVDNSVGNVILTSSTGKVYYVSTSGSNSNPGIISKPFKNVAYAVSKMIAGDTTYVRGGIYREPEIILFKTSGTKTAPIKLLNYPNELPVIDFGVNGDYKKVQRFEFRNAAGNNKAIGWITLEGFEIRNGYDGIKYYNLHDSVIRRNIIHHNVAQGIKGNGSLRVTIDRNIIHTNGDFVGCANGRTQAGNNNTICNLLHGIYIDGNYVTISNNIIYNNLALGITQNGSSAYSPTTHPGPEFSGANNWLIANNTFAYQYYAPAISVWGSRTNNSTIINNIFYENSRSRSTSATNGISLFSSTPAKGIVIKNNISYATGSGGTKFFGDGYNSYKEGLNYSQSGNIVNTLDPKFVNAPATLPSSPNFMLTSSSPGINRGLTISAIRVDIRGVTRPRGVFYDIGAYEY